MTKVSELLDTTETMDEISAPDLFDSSLQQPFVFDGLGGGDQSLEMEHTPPLMYP